jgi:hypothetical protein
MAKGKRRDAVVEVNDLQREWLNPYISEFAEQRGIRGCIKGSAMEYVRAVIIPAFYETYYPNSTEEEQQTMFESVKGVSALDP